MLHCSPPGSTPDAAADRTNGATESSSDKPNKVSLGMRLTACRILNFQLEKMLTLIFWLNLQLSAKKNCQQTIWHRDRCWQWNVSSLPVIAATFATNCSGILPSDYMTAEIDTCNNMSTLIYQATEWLHTSYWCSDFLMLYRSVLLYITVKNWRLI